MNERVPPFIGLPKAMKARFSMYKEEPRHVSQGVYPREYSI